MYGSQNPTTVNNDRNLVDPFCVFQGNLRKYWPTWRRMNPIQQGRLDFFLI